jgi:hypothetical protein
MSEKELAAKMDEALANVDPNRRKFLGILLAGVAAAPLLTSASLDAQHATGAHFPKNSTSAKGNTSLKNDAVIKNNNSTIKSNNNALKNSRGASPQLKNNAYQNKGANTQLKNNANQYKGASPQIKAATGTGSEIKNSSGANKLDANANSSKIK